MNPYLRQQQEAFKKTLQRQPELPKNIIQRPETIPSPTPSAATSASSGRPLNSYLHSIITFLKTADRPVRLQEIHEKLGLNLLGQPDLLDKICRNDRVTYDGQVLHYNPAFNIKSKEDILLALSKRQDMSGIDLAELKEAYPKVEDAVMDLVKRKEIFLIRTREDGPKVLFLNDFKVERQLDADFRHLWSSISIPPDEFELRAAIFKAGMKPSSSGASNNNGNGTNGAQPIVQKKKAVAKRPFRRPKITNDYLEGIDLSIVPENTE